MNIVIEVRDNQVQSVNGFKSAISALDFAVGIVLEQEGETPLEAKVRECLLRDGQYAPSSHPEWSVAVVKRKAKSERPGPLERAIDRELNKVNDVNQLVFDGIEQNDLIARGFEGDPAALAALEELSTHSHDGNCSYRSKGECDCSKVTINTILEAHGRTGA